jgi:hypothetical protein
MNSWGWIMAASASRSSWSSANPAVERACTSTITKRSYMSWKAGQSGGLAIRSERLLLVTFLSSAPAVSGNFASAEDRTGTLQNGQRHFRSETASLLTAEGGNWG